MSRTAPALDTDVIRIACWNVEHNGLAGHTASGDDRRRHLAHQVLRAHRPHIVLRQELTLAHLDGKRPLHEEGKQLGLSAVMAPGNPESPNPTGVLFDPSLFALHAEYAHVTNGWHPICNPVLTLRGDTDATKPLSLASFHLCSYDPATRETEAKRLVTLGGQKRTAVIGGDCNSYPHRTDDESVPLPDWTEVKDPAHFEHRTVRTAAGRASDTIPDEVLASTKPGGGRIFVELGHHAATELSQPGALEATASLWRKDQGHRSRIDRMYCTPDLAPALMSLEVFADDSVAEASDHALVLATFDRTAFRRALTPAR
ncbi:endonuclease/exonuclease/phosphatase family protein [Streptomyces sp. NPDC086182]|uniref:endonuclease/exonuclease/phosphatase family protein n=1 Tax=Streptomyces sp. NPDC086182 TaxID=3155058 RepID=UPI0034227FBE